MEEGAEGRSAFALRELSFTTLILCFVLSHLSFQIRIFNLYVDPNNNLRVLAIKGVFSLNQRYDYYLIKKPP